MDVCVPQTLLTSCEHAVDNFETDLWGMCRREMPNLTPYSRPLLEVASIMWQNRGHFRGNPRMIQAWMDAMWDLYRTVFLAMKLCR